MRVRTLSTFLGSLTSWPSRPPPRGATTGGAAAGSSTPSHRPGTAGDEAGDPPLADHREVAPPSYKGPVYEKTATGEVVPYVPTGPGARS